MPVYRAKNYLAQQKKRRDAACAHGRCQVCVTAPATPGTRSCDACRAAAAARKRRSRGIVPLNLRWLDGE